MLLNFKFLIKWLINLWRYFVFAIHNRNCSPTSVQSQMAQCIKLPGDNIQFLLHIVYFCTGVIYHFLSRGVNMYAMLVGSLPFTVEPFNIKALHKKMLNGEINPIPAHLSTRTLRV